MGGSLDLPWLQREFEIATRSSYKYSMWHRTDVWTLEVCLKQRSSKLMWNHMWNLTLRKVNYVHLPLLPRSNGWNLNAQLFVGALWEMKFEGFIICLHLLKNAWRVQFRLLWSRIWATLFKNPPFLGGWGADKEWNVPKWSFQQISIILKLNMCF